MIYNKERVFRSMLMEILHDIGGANNKTTWTTLTQNKSGIMLIFLVLPAQNKN